MPSLYESTKIGAVDVKNRVFMAPLTRNRALPDGTPADMAVKYYKQRATAGLIFTEATQISPMGKGYLNTPGIHSDQQVAAWKKITDAVHQEGGKIFLQLWHVGRISHTSLLPKGEVPVAPSPIRAKAQTFIGGEEGMVDVSEPRALTVAEIKETVQDYRKAAENARKAGFDGVEVHAANGYLINQFLADKTNKRDDEYGGSVENRVRFLREILDEVVDVWGADRVGIRLSPTGTFNDVDDSDPLTLYTAVIDMLNAYELACLHMVEQFPGMETSADDRAVLDSLIAQWHGFYIANGDYGKDNGEEAIYSGKADAIAFGRIYIANPDLPERLEKGAALNEPDQATFYGGDERGYTDYPFLEDSAEAA